MLVGWRAMRVIRAHPSEPLPYEEEQRDEQQHRGRDHHDLESGHRYFTAVGVVPMNGIAAPGVRYCGSWPFHLLMA